MPQIYAVVADQDCYVREAWPCSSVADGVGLLRMRAAEYRRDHKSFRSHLSFAVHAVGDADDDGLKPGAVLARIDLYGTLLLGHDLMGAPSPG